MKAMNQKRTNQILFGFLVLTLAMSKSWLVTADTYGRADMASESTTVEYKGKTYDVGFTPQTVVRKGAQTQKIVNGNLETTQGEATKQTEARISINGCQSCAKTVVLADGELVASVQAAAVKLLEAQEKEEAKAKEEEKKAQRLQARKDKCELVEVDGEWKETKRSTRRRDDESHDVLLAQIDCLGDNDKLTMKEVRGKLSAQIRNLLISEDPEDQANGRELLDALSDNASERGELASYIDEMENYTRAVGTIREAGSVNDLQTVDGIAGCMNPSTYFGMAPNAMRCSMLGYGPRNSIERQSMQDGYASIQALACQYMITNLGSRNVLAGNSKCNTLQRPYNNLDGRPVFGEVYDDGSPVFSSYESASSRFRRATSGTGSGLMFEGNGGGIPQVGDRVYGYENRYDQNALIRSNGTGGTGWRGTTPQTQNNGNSRSWSRR